MHCIANFRRTRSSRRRRDEDGVWRLWSVTIDEHSWETPNRKAGWAGAEDPDR